MGIFLGIEYLLLFLLSTWMTATAIRLLKGAAVMDEDMDNLHGQVLGAVRAGDLPRAILILEGEPGPLAAILSNVLTEATKFTPKLRVAYKVTLESIKRRSMVATNPFRLVMMFAPFIGIVWFIVSIFGKNQTSFTISLWLMLLSFLIALVSWFINGITVKQDQQRLLKAGDLGRQVLNFLLSPESPLPALRGRAFPPAQ